MLRTCFKKYNGGELIISRTSRTVRGTLQGLFAQYIATGITFSPIVVKTTDKKIPERLKNPLPDCSDENFCYGRVGFEDGTKRDCY